MKGTVALSTAAAAGSKIYFITGATDGIGQFTAQQVARAGDNLVLVHGRNPDKVDRVVKEIQKNGGKAQGFIADLSSLGQVRKLGEEVRSQYNRLDGVLMNAGTFDGDYSGKRQVTIDGNEYSLAVNVLAPFLLTSILLDRIQGRLLITSSISMGCGDALDDLNCKQKWSAHRAYSLSKLCDAMIAMEIHQRYGNPPHLCVHTMDPGTVNTKMLQAGWGNCGIPISSATRSFELLTDSKYGQCSGEIVGAWPDREVSDQAKRTKLWNNLVELTGAVWP